MDGHPLILPFSVIATPLWKNEWCPFFFVYLFVFYWDELVMLLMYRSSSWIAPTADIVSFSLLSTANSLLSIWFCFFSTEINSPVMLPKTKTIKSQNLMSLLSLD